MTKNTFEVKEVLTFGWTTFKQDPWFYIGVTAGLTIFTMVVNALTGNGHGIFSLIGFLIGVVASTVVTIAYARLALSAEAGKHVGWEGLWAPEYFLNTLGASILQGIIILIGIILLVIPGIVAALMLSMTQLSVVDKKLTPIAAIKESYHLTKGHLFELFLLMIALILLNMVGLILLVVGLLVTLPISLIAVAHVYRKLAALQEPMVVAPVPSTPEVS